jgi:hypothetical protein
MELMDATADGIRYGFYLRPSYAMARAQAEMHDLLTRQYGLRVAGRFMPHATIKGFFMSQATVAEIIGRIDPVMAGRPPFPVYNRGPIPFGKSGIALDIQRTPDGSRNEPLQAVHASALTALLPLVASDCNFTPHEWYGDRFSAHLTLAMADIPGWAFGEVLDFVRQAAPIGPPTFTADTFHLFAFFIEDWEGNWWETMRWKLLHSWRLAPNESV